jgi:type IV pilus assembly protein PilY1
MVSKSLKSRLLLLTAKGVLLAMGGMASAASLSIVDVPLFLSGNVAPLNMLVLGRDHKLFYEAYSDHSDLDGDGFLDVGYKGFETRADGTFKIDYYGYFDSYKCYTHDGNKFVPASVNTNKRCSGAWSGDWLNWATMTRIDALRKVLYGGKRYTDSATETILERSHIPQDAHSWGKEYTSTAVDGYDIADVAPYTQPTPAGSRHFFASTTPMTSDGDWTTNLTVSPRLRVLTDQPSDRRIWHWVSKESPVAGGSINTGSGNVTVTPTDLRVRVAVCVSDALKEANCRKYPTSNTLKPTGLLQDFGESDAMLFGLLTGSYAKSKSGGVVRKDVGDIKNEINWQTDGTFTNTVGIIKTFDLLRMPGYEDYTSDANGRGVYYTPGLVTTRPFDEGEFGGNWGNPVAEMMYEAMRYFAQSSTASSSAPTGVFNYTGSFDDAMGLPKVNTWANPYGTGKPNCAKPFQTVMSDVNTSYDSDQVPGGNWGSISTDLPGSPNATNLGGVIWNREIGSAGSYFIGQSGVTSDGAPTPKTVTSFGNIRGLSPEEPTKEGSYYAASMAYHGLMTDLNTVNGQQKMQTFAVALASPLPRIEIPVNGRTVTIIPFAKSVGGCAGVDGTRGVFQPTNQIVDFYVEYIAPDRRSGTFQVNFEDVESGNDHDMDAIARYAYTVNADNSVTIGISSDYAAGCIVQHMGYVISGTTRDGIYLEVRDRDTDVADDPDYFLDTTVAFTGTPPPAPDSGIGTWDDNVALPLVSTRTFSTGATTSAGVLKDPLWYAAKWGGFKDTDNDSLPDPLEWDENGDGQPDNYFLVTNALTLEERLSAAFREIGRRQGSASAASVNTGSISGETRVYQAKFSSGEWTGQLLSFPVVATDDPLTPINEIGTLRPAEWTAWQQLNSISPSSRVIITTNSPPTSTTVGTPISFTWASLDATRRTSLQTADPASNLRGSQRVDYLRGVETGEQRNGGVFRDRLTPDPADTDGVAPQLMLPNKLGDIVSSSPVFVGKPNGGYSDSLESAPYSTFVTTYTNRTKMVYVGANDGMLHGFDAGTDATTYGRERVAFIPSAVFPQLQELTKPTYNYNHKFFVDGTPTVRDVFYGGAWHTVLVGGLNKGGQSIYALDITDPSAFGQSAAAADALHLWEYSDADLGYTFSRPTITRMANGQWVAIFGNGYNNSTAGTPAPISTTGRAYLYIVNIQTGALIRKIDTGAGSVGTPNGLATPAVIDIDGDRNADYAYAGDLLGNLWKFDLRGTSSSGWGLANGGSPLYIAVDPTDATIRQPITSRPEVNFGPRGVGLMVLFGTGKFLEQTDKSPTRTQTFYGIHDLNTGTAATDIVPSGRGSLTEQTITFEGNVTYTGPSGSYTVSSRVTSANAMTNRGWYLNLLSPNSPTFRGEMQVSNPALRNGRIIFTTLIPDVDPCVAGGTSWLMEMDALSGARLETAPFDMNRDGLFTDADNRSGVPVSGRQSEVGITQTGGILDYAGDPAVPGGGNVGPNGMEFKYLSGSSEDAAGSNLQIVTENPGPGSRGRQSWRQVK